MSGDEDDLQDRVGKLFQFPVVEKEDGPVPGRMYVMPRREPDESIESWAKRCTAIDGVNDISFTGYFDEVIDPHAFDNQIGKEVPLRLGVGGPVIGTARIVNDSIASVLPIIKSINEALRAVWKGMCGVHDADVDGFHKFMRESGLGSCLVCEVRKK